MRQVDAAHLASRTASQRAWLHLLSCKVVLGMVVAMRARCFAVEPCLHVRAASHAASCADCRDNAVVALHR
jgi:hypothetical protein